MLKSTVYNWPPPQADAVVAPSEPDLRRRASLVSAHAPSDGCFELRLPGLYATHFSRTDTELVGLCLSQTQSLFTKRYQCDDKPRPLNSGVTS